jgi:ribonuclease BN (tRNA processing enzyme)
MNIKILGTRGEITQKARSYSKQSGILIDDVLLLDLGEKQYLKIHPKWILLTHLHPDHAYFMRRGAEEDPETEAKIFAPEKGRKNICLLRRKRKLGPYTVTPIPTHHSKNVLSQAYLIERAGKSILYTGDLVWIDKKYHPLLKKVDLIITEGSFVREGGMIRKDLQTGKLFGHAGIPNLIRLFHPYCQQIVFVHFGSWFYRNIKTSRQKLLALGREYGVSVVVGRDGRHLRV